VASNSRNSRLKSRRKPRHVEEHEAESYAHRALAAHGLEVPDASTHGARAYVGQCVEEDRAKGIPICPLAEARLGTPSCELRLAARTMAGDAIADR
jgi:hypothetical protein